MNTLNGQRILLVGLGESGLACARWVCAQGAFLTVVDSRSTPPGLSALLALDQAVSCFTELSQFDWMFDRVLVSPGLAPSSELMRSVVALAKAHSVPVESEIDLFAEALATLKTEVGYCPKIIGVTGTNGKTTTVKMVTCLVKFAGLNAIAAGNISPAALDALLDAQIQNKWPDVWVLELSSFQLHWTRRLVCDAAVVLNITQDHLDWHNSMTEYAADKARIFSSCPVVVVNRDDAVVMALPVPDFAHRVSFGTTAPQSTGDLGLVREGGMLWLSQAQSDQEAFVSKRKKQDTVNTVSKLLMPIDALQVLGLHNATNGLAALALTQAIGLPMAKLLHGLRTYKGEPHRVEFVMQVEGVDFFDDSKGTNVGATVAALNGLERACVLIAGGDGKGQDFAPLVVPAERFCSAVVLIGKDAALLQNAFAAENLMCVVVDSLHEAVARAFEMARHSIEKPCVLLSPACASFDMFDGYAHRAHVFVQAVHDLANDRGLIC